MPPETLRRARAVLPVKENLSNAYGLTETHGVATLNGGKDLIGRATSIGRPLPILDMQIGDPDGNPLPDGQLGELQISGPTSRRATGTVPRRPRRASSGAGCAPAISARATPRASSSSPTAPRT